MGFEPPVLIFFSPLRERQSLSRYIASNYLFPKKIQKKDSFEHGFSRYDTNLC